MIEESKTPPPESHLSVTEEMVEAAMEAAEVPHEERAGVAQYFDRIIHAALAVALFGREPREPDVRPEVVKACKDMESARQSFLTGALAGKVNSYAKQEAADYVQWLHAGNSTGHLSEHAIESLEKHFIHVINHAIAFGSARVGDVLSDKVEGLEADLSSAVEVAFKRGATDWVRLNYPDQYRRLMAEVSP